MGWSARDEGFVAWLKIMNKNGTQTETVLTADEFLGPYTIVKEGLKPLNMSAGDFDLAMALDGKAYYYFEWVHSETICAERWLLEHILTGPRMQMPSSERSWLKSEQKFRRGINHPPIRYILREHRLFMS